MSEAPSWLMTMRGLTGTKEVPGAGDNPAILAMARFIGEQYPEMRDYCDQYTHDEIAWCGLTVAYCMAKSGIRPVFRDGDAGKFLFARAWREFGTALAVPKLGAVMVFRRAGGGHVGLYEGEDANTYSIRGGNQGDSVSVIKKPKSDFLGAFWPDVVTDAVKV